MAEKSFRGEVGEALEVLAEGLAPFVDQQMSRAMADEDWILIAAQRMGKPPEMVIAATDPQFQLDVLYRFWGPAFGGALAERYREVVAELREARNQWAHFDERFPVDLDSARRVHDLVEDLLAAAGAAQAAQIPAMLARLELSAVRATGAAAPGAAMEDILGELRSIRAERAQLEAQLDRAHGEVATVGNRARAVSRQLAELQTQYAAVSGLQRRYDQLHQALGERLRSGAPVQDEVADVVLAVEQLASESARLRKELSETRDLLSSQDVAQTPAGRRLLFLVTAMILVLLAVIVMLTISWPSGD